MKTELYHSSHPLNSVDLSCFFSYSGKGISGINNSLKCHQIPWSPRKLRPRAGGTGMLTLDIKQHFISYYGVTTTSYNCSFQKCHSQMVGNEAYHIDIIYSRSQPDSSSYSEPQCCAALCQLHKFKSLCDCFRDADTKTLVSVCDWFKVKPLLRNLLAHLMRPSQKLENNQTSLLFYAMFWVCSLCQHAG